MAVHVPRRLHDGDLGDVRHVLHVDHAQVARRVAVDGNVDLARPQREPADRRADGHAEAGRAEPGHQGGRIDRTRHDHAGDPAPVPAHHHPAAVVQRREAPRRFVDPGPAPGTDPDPAAEAVRRPGRRHTAREPHRPVVGDRAPVAVLVEQLDAGGFARNVGGAADRLFPRLAGGDPLVEAVGSRGGDLEAHHRRGDEFAALAAADHESAAVDADAHAAEERGDRGQAGRPVDIDAVAADVVEHQPLALGEHLDLAEDLAAAQPQRHAAAQHRDLDEVVVDAGKVDRRVLVEAQRGGADAHLHAPAAAGFDAPAAGHRPVQQRLLAAAGGQIDHRHRPGQQRHAADAARRVDRIGVRRRLGQRGAGAGDEGEDGAEQLQREAAQRGNGPEGPGRHRGRRHGGQGVPVASSGRKRIRRAP